MTASSPVTMEDLVNGLIITSSNGDYHVISSSGGYRIAAGSSMFNPVTISSDGLTITFGSFSGGGPTFTGFTYNS